MFNRQKEKQDTPQDQGPDFEKWEFQYPEGVTDDDIVKLRERRQTIYAPTGSVHKNGEVQKLPVLVTEPLELKTDTIIFRIPAWNVDLGNDQNGLYDAALSLATGARVISINNPGIYGKREKKLARTQLNDLTPEQHKDLDEGSLREVGAAVMRAAFFAEQTMRSAAGDAVEGEEQLPGFVLWGGSLGAGVAAGAVNEAIKSNNAKRIKVVVVDEQVNDRDRTQGDLKDGARDSSKDTKKYIEQNPEPLRNADEGLVRFIWRGIRRFTANRKYLKALTKGRFREDLGDPEKFHEAGFDAPIVIANGSSSAQSSTKQNDELYDWLQTSGAPVKRLVFEGDSHDRLINVQSAAEIYRQAIEAAQ